MDFVRVRHPQTGDETRVAAFQYEQHLAPLGFALVGEDDQAATLSLSPPSVPEARDEPPVPPSDPETSDQGGEGVVPSQGSGDALTDAIGDVIVADALRAAGLGTPAQIGKATDEELLAIGGVGPARLEKLRAYATTGTEEVSA